MNNKVVRLIISISLNLIVLVAGIFIIMTAATKAYSFGYNIFNERSVDTVEQARQTDVVIPQNVSAKELASIICEKGLAKDETIFYFQIMLSDYKDKIKGGTYTLNTGMKPTEILETISLEAKEE